MIGQGRESQDDNNLLFTCGLIDYISRKTKNKRADVVNQLGEDRISKIYDLADVYHCDNIDSVSETFIEEACGGIRIMKTKNLLDPKSWVKVLDIDELGLGDIEGKALDNGLLEGPELFIINKADRANKEALEYGIIADQYAIGAGYLPIVTTDIDDVNNSKGSWKLLKSDEYSFDKLKKRHGTILRVTKEEIDRLKKAFC